MEPIATGGTLAAEARGEGHCEGLVVTCAHCGRPATECDGQDCAHVLETRDFMVPGFRTGRGSDAES